MLMKVPTPMRYAGGYELHLYCDTMNLAHHYNEFPHRYYSQSAAESKNYARTDGWKIHPDRTATCPKCRKM